MLSIGRPHRAPKFPIAGSATRTSAPSGICFSTKSVKCAGLCWPLVSGLILNPASRSIGCDISRDRRIWNRAEHQRVIHRRAHARVRRCRRLQHLQNILWRLLIFRLRGNLIRSRHRNRAQRDNPNNRSQQTRAIIPNNSRSKIHDSLRTTHTLRIAIPPTCLTQCRRIVAQHNSQKYISVRRKAAEKGQSSLVILLHQFVKSSNPQTTEIAPGRARCRARTYPKYPARDPAIPPSCTDDRRRQRVENIADRHDLRLNRNRVTLQTIRISSAINFFVVSARNLRNVAHVSRPRNLHQKIKTVHYVRFNFIPLARIKAPLRNRQEANLLRSQQPLLSPARGSRNVCCAML